MRPSRTLERIYPVEFTASQGVHAPTMTIAWAGGVVATDGSLASTRRNGPSPTQRKPFSWQAVESTHRNRHLRPRDPGGCEPYSGCPGRSTVRDSKVYSV